MGAAAWKVGFCHWVWSISSFRDELKKKKHPKLTPLQNKKPGADLRQMLWITGDLWQTQQEFQRHTFITAFFNKSDPTHFKPFLMTILVIHRKPPINQCATANKQNPKTTKEVKGQLGTAEPAHCSQQPWNFPLYCQNDLFPPALTHLCHLENFNKMRGSKERRWEYSLLEMYFKFNEKSTSPFTLSTSCSYPPNLRWSPAAIWVLQSTTLGLQPTDTGTTKNWTGFSSWPLGATVNPRWDSSPSSTRWEAPHPTTSSANCLCSSLQVRLLFIWCYSGTLQTNLSDVPALCD